MNNDKQNDTYQNDAKQNGAASINEEVINSGNVLACIDGSNFSQAVCDYAAWIARSVNAPLHLLHTIEHSPQPAVSDLTGAIGLGASEDLLNELTFAEQNHSRLLIQQGKLMLNAAKERAAAHGVSEIECKQRHGHLSEALIELEQDIRVLVLGIRGEEHKVDDKGVGTQLETVVRSLHRPILVVNRAFSEPKKIMLAYDGSEAAEKALSMIALSPLFHSTPCHLVHVENDNNKSGEVLKRATERLEAHGIQVTPVSLTGKIDEVLPQYQAEQDIDLTVMGAFSHSRVRNFLLGSFTAKMLLKTRRPLLLLR